ncbi:amidase domain-containing protein [Pseudoflavonifractor capillosus]|uniref:amidase domain-containing protein n=1 Tax=Pseudoflavonifractor capillosus TaxID=106588 RepID=UPI00195AA110|nr:amidase domain-containing protein [Pseudoflavonifractor capillosus]MBM6693808.1 amidase domain-containing protein [Pseudoflavonifractor capillosus]
MKKLTALLSAVLMIALMGIQGLATSASEISLYQTEGGTILSDSQLQNAIGQYFNIRSQTVSPVEAQRLSNTVELMEQITYNQNIINRETDRKQAIEQLRSTNKINVLRGNSSVHIKTVEAVSATMLEVGVYEWVWLEYDDGNNGPADKMGYGLNHSMTWEKKQDGTYTLVDDILQERDLLSCEITNPQEDVTLTHEQPLSTAKSGNVNSRSKAVLDLNSLVNYANKWVIKGTTSQMQNPAYYNKTQYGWYSQDCANFVSQCLHAAKMVNDYGSGKNNSNWDGTQWWFDLNPTPQYENYNVSPPSWRAVSQFISYWTKQGYNKVSGTSASIYPGNPVILGNYHVGICVGTNSSGVPVVNAHNQDVYQVPWNVFGSGASVSTIQIFSGNCTGNHVTGGYKYNDYRHWRGCGNCSALVSAVSAHTFRFYNTYYRCTACGYTTTHVGGVSSIPGVQMYSK